MFLNFKNEYEFVYREEGKYKLNIVIFFFRYYILREEELGEVRMKDYFFLYYKFIIIWFKKISVYFGKYFENI